MTTKPTEHEMLTYEEFVAKEGKYDPDEPGIYGKLGQAATALHKLRTEPHGEGKRKAPNCPLVTGLRPCMCERRPRCPECNYSDHDARFEMYHSACKGKIPAERSAETCCNYPERDLIHLAAEEFARLSPSIQRATLADGLMPHTFGDKYVGAK